jgi:hypothetical protein
MEKMKRKELQETLVQKMKEWQELESEAIIITRAIGDKSSNPLIKNIMVTLNSDSARHRSVQQLIIDSLEKEPVTISTDDMIVVWNLIEKHIELEKKMVSYVQKTLESMQGEKALLIQRYLLEYLHEDEKKHETMLNNLRAIKDGMYPYGG